MRLAKITTCALTAALLLPAAAAAQDDTAASAAPDVPPASSSPASSTPPAALGTEPVPEGLLALIPAEVAGLALREQATAFGVEEMRANSGEQELQVLDRLISAAGDPTEGLGVAATFATTADGAGGILLQVISVPGMSAADGVGFWTEMLDLANATSEIEQVEIGGKSVTTYLRADDPDVMAHLYGVDGAAWLIIASDQAMLDDLISQLP